MITTGNRFRARAYHKAAESLIQHPETNFEDLIQLPNIGISIFQTLKKYDKISQYLDDMKKTPIYIFTKIYGIGPKKAKQLIEVHKITTIAELQKQQDDVLNNLQKKGLKYFKDSQLRIQRAEIDEFKMCLQQIFEKLKYVTDSTFEIVGSYRRGATNSGDIDIIITNSKNNRQIFEEFLTALKKKGIIIETFSQGHIKSLTMGRIKNYPARRIDFMYSPPTEYAFALLYFTGSKEFNVVMRARALSMGFSLNEHGFSLGNKKKISWNFPTEESIFEFLGMVYKTPEKRINGTAVKDI